MLRLDERRLLDALDELADIGAIEGGGCARLALTDDDRIGRDLVVGWMRALGLDVRVDAIGNVIGNWCGAASTPPAAGHDRIHIDTVRTGGRYDGNLRGAGGLEVVRARTTPSVTTRRPSRWRSSPTKRGHASPRHAGLR